MKLKLLFTTTLIPYLAFAANLVDVCELALENNTKYLNSLSANESALNEYDFLPNLSVNWSFNYHANNSGNAPSFIENPSHVSMNVSPSIYYKYKALQKQTAKKKIADKKTTQQILHDVAFNYLDLIELIKKQDSLKFELKANRTELVNNQKKYNSGLITDTDVSIWENKYAQSESQLLSNLMDIKKKKLDLERQVLTNISSVSSFSNKHPIDITRQVAFSSNNQYEVQSAQLEAATQESLHEEKLLETFLPSMQISIGHDTFNPSDVTANFSATINFPVGTIIANSTALERLRLKSLMAKRDYKFSKWNASRSHTFEKNQVILARKLIKNTQISYKSAFKRYNEAKRKHAQGLINQLQLNDAIKDVTKARNEMISSQVKLLKEHIELLQLNNQLDLNAIIRIQKLLRHTAYIPRS